MSWIKCLKEVDLSKSISVPITISKDLLNHDGVFAFLYVDYASVIESALPNGVKLADVLGSGNAGFFSYQLFEFVWDTLVTADAYNDFGFDSLCLNSDADITMVVNIFGVSVETENNFTSTKSRKDTNVFSFLWPMPKEDAKKYSLQLFGYYSPAQSLLFANGTDEAISDTLFHEHIHAVVDSLESELRHTMYGGDPSSIKEEIMTHALTDRFDLFNNLRELFKSIKVEKKASGSIVSPVGVKFLSSGNQVNSSEEKTATVSPKIGERKQDYGLSIVHKCTVTNRSNYFSNSLTSSQRVALQSRMSELRKLHKSSKMLEAKFNEIKSTLYSRGPTRSDILAERTVFTSKSSGKAK